MRRWVVVCGCGVALFTVATSAWAQAAPVYVSAGYAAGWREPGSVSEDPPARGVVHSFVIAVGAEVTPALGVEGSVGLFTSQALTWRLGYSSLCCRELQTSDRDMLVLGWLRYAPECRRRVCMEVLIGGGFNLHRTVTTVTGDCGSAFAPHPCVPVSGNTPTSDHTAGWAVGVGADVSVTVSRHLTVSPTVRLLAIQREEFLTGYLFRGPVSGSGFIPTIGVSATWHRRARR